MSPTHQLRLITRHNSVALRCPVALQKRVIVLAHHLAFYDLFTADIFDSSGLLACLITKGATLPFHFKYTTMTTTEKQGLGVTTVFLFFFDLIL